MERNQQYHRSDLEGCGIGNGHRQHCDGIFSKGDK
jgi:hypothetical protein